MAITRFQDLPSTNTPINSANLNGNFDDLGAKVGTSIDSNYRTNIIKGKNLCDGLNLGYYLNNACNLAGTSTNDNGLVIDVSRLGIVTISTTATQTRYRVACISDLPSGSGVTAYNGVNKDGTSDSITINTGNYSYLVINATDLSKIQCEKGSSATTYQPYITPSINVDGEDIFKIESGNNSNGSYIKYSDGTLICYGTATTVAWVSVNYPATFIATPTVTTGGNSGTAETTTIMIIKTANVGTSSFRTCRIVGSNYDSGKVDWIAIGKWK